MILSAPAPLNPQTHRSAGFASGVPALDTWLLAYASQGQRRDASRTYVVCDESDAVRGFYTLVATQVEHHRASDPVRRGMSRRFPIPAVLLARLAVDRNAQGQGLGAGLLGDAMRRCVRVSEEVGVRALVVDALDDRAAGFYRRFGLQALTDDGLTLMAPMAQLRAATQTEP